MLPSMMRQKRQLMTATVYRRASTTGRSFRSSEQCAQKGHGKNADGEPSEPVAPFQVKSFVMHRRNGRDKRRKGRSIAASFSDNAAAIIADRQVAVFGDANNAEPVLNAAHDGDMSVPRPIQIEVPCRH